MDSDDLKTKAEAASLLRGRCHCGAVGWWFEVAGQPMAEAGDLAESGDLAATQCNCTVCRRTGALWIYGEAGHDVDVEDPEGRLASYVRGSGSLSFDFCSRCGNLVCWRGRKPRPNGRLRMAVNIRLAEPADVAGIPLQRFDGLDSFEDLPRDGRHVSDVWF